MKIPVISIVALVLSGCEKPIENPSLELENLYESWIQEIQNGGFIGFVDNPDGSRTQVGPGFRDGERVQSLASTKRLIDFRPRLQMIKYCLSRHSTKEPFAMTGELLMATYPGRLSQESWEQMSEDALALAKSGE